MVQFLIGLHVAAVLERDVALSRRKAERKIFTLFCWLEGVFLTNSYNGQKYTLKTTKRVNIFRSASLLENTWSHSTRPLTT